MGIKTSEKRKKRENYIFFKNKMTWQLMWRNMRAATLNATLQLLVILAVNLRVTRDNYFYGGFINFFLQFKQI